jgi:hypothetical protein
VYATESPLGPAIIPYVLTRFAPRRPGYARADTQVSGSSMLAPFLGLRYLGFHTAYCGVQVLCRSSLEFSGLVCAVQDIELVHAPVYVGAVSTAC